VDTRWRYFAYGSNMSGEQMRSRCPGANDPLNAVLDDHDWLLNRRGVATLEPAPGREVHGVLWDVTADDLAALDRWEGVPRYYRRSTMAVRTNAGSVDAEVYIDPVVDPISDPEHWRPGYLDVIRRGAAERALPEHWQRTLARWSQVPMLRAEPTSSPPSSLTELLARPGVCEQVELGSQFGFMALHGGELEAMTDVVARRAAAACGASWYVVLHPEAERHHLSSTRFRPAESAALARFIDHVEVIVSLHGYGRRSRWTQLLAGGSNRPLAEHVAEHLRAALPGYEVITDLDAIPAELRGMRPDNPVNLAREGGVQLELPPRVRGQSPRSPVPGPDGISSVTHDLVSALAAAARAWPLG